MAVRESLTPVGDCQCLYDVKAKMIGMVKNKELEIMIIICFALSDFYNLVFHLHYPHLSPRFPSNDKPHDGNYMQECK